MDRAPFRGNRVRVEALGVADAGIGPAGEQRLCHRDLAAGDDGAFKSSISELA